MPVQRVIRLDAYWQIGGDGQSAVPVTTNYRRDSSNCGVELGSAQLLEVEPGTFVGTLGQKRSDGPEPFLKRFADSPSAIAAQLIRLSLKAWDEPDDGLHMPAEVDVLMFSYNGEGFSHDVEVLAEWKHHNFVEPED